MNLYEKLNYNWEKGYYSLAKDKDGEFVFFTTKYTLESFKGSCHYSTREKSINNQGESIYYKKYLEDNDNNLRIIETIHPSELMGEGFKTGNKVRIKKNAKEVVIETVTASRGVLIDGNFYPPTTIEPVFEEEEYDILFKANSGEKIGILPQKIKINGVEYNITKA